MTKYYTHILQAPARALYCNAITATRPPSVAEAKTKYNVLLGIESEADATALFKMEAEALTDLFGSFDGPDAYYLAARSGESAANAALQKAEIDGRGKSEDERFKLMERAETRATMLREYKAVLSASSRVAFHDTFHGDRINNDLNAKEADRAATMGFRLGVVTQKGIIELTNPLAFNQNSNKFYAGAYVGGSFNLTPWARKTSDAKDGVSAYINNLVFVKDGKRLSSRPDMQDQFAHYKGMASAYSPMTQDGQSAVEGAMNGAQQAPQGQTQQPPAFDPHQF